MDLGAVYAKAIELGAVGIYDLSSAGADPATGQVKFIDKSVSGKDIEWYYAPNTSRVSQPDSDGLPCSYTPEERWWGANTSMPTSAHPKDWHAFIIAKVDSFRSLEPAILFGGSTSSSSDVYPNLHLRPYGGSAKLGAKHDNSTQLATAELKSAGTDWDFGRWFSADARSTSGGYTIYYGDGLIATATTTDVPVNFQTPSFGCRTFNAVNGQGSHNGRSRVWVLFDNTLSEEDAAIFRAVISAAAAGLN